MVKSHELICLFIRFYLVPLPPYILYLNSSRIFRSCILHWSQIWSIFPNGTRIRVWSTKCIIVHLWSWTWGWNILVWYGWSIWIVIGIWKKWIICIIVIIILSLNGIVERISNGFTIRIFIYFIVWNWSITVLWNTNKIRLNTKIIDE